MSNQSRFRKPVGPTIRKMIAGGVLFAGVSFIATLAAWRYLPGLPNSGFVARRTGFKWLPPPDWQFGFYDMTITVKRGRVSRTFDQEHRFMLGICQVDVSDTHVSDALGRYYASQCTSAKEPVVIVAWH